ncbi:hypothetical protein LEN26_019886 [Aphanomyces euteiches]|nr:hypothetical protein LEN26_019886 [Aphanomyces euteiches]KAH9106873.1 hypothetical protein AeMF1_017652 [Aphanomyces euteiches]KAH9195969.1 hypothetical protein AeNC1_002049 [Aphanomyces euteiches]
MSKASVIDSPMGPPPLHAVGCGAACPSKPCSSIASKISTVQPSATALKEFRKRWTILSEAERIQCLKGTGVQFFATVAELVPCLACRSGAESLFLRATTTLPLLCGSLSPNMINSSIQLNDSGAILFYTDQSFVLHPSYLQTADATLALFLSHEVQHVILSTAGSSKHKNHHKSNSSSSHHHMHHSVLPPFPPGPHLHQMTKHNTTLKVKTTTFNYETTMKLQMHASGTSSTLTTTTTHHSGNTSSLSPGAAMQSALSQSAAGILHGPPPPMAPGGLDLGGLGSLTLGLGLSSLSLGLGMNYAKSSKRCTLHSAKLKTHPRPSAFTSLWEKMSAEYQSDITQIDSDQFLNDLECYLRRHRFCCRCKEKVLEAYDLLVGSGCSESDCEDCAGLHCFSDKSSQDDSSHEEHQSSTSSNDEQSSYLFDELSFCRDTNQIVVPCNLDYLLQLMDRADQEVIMDRHARTLAEAQDEVLTCMGLVVWDKLQMMWSKIQCEERSAELLLYCSIATIKHNFDMAVEALHGQEIMEQLLAEEEEDEKRTVRKKEKRKEKKKKRKAKKQEEISEEDAIPEKERQLLSSMGWEHDPLDGDDSEDAIPEDDLVYWKKNSQNLESKRLEQRQKLQEKFQALLQRNNP